MKANPTSTSRLASHRLHRGPTPLSLSFLAVFPPFAMSHPFPSSSLQFLFDDALRTGLRKANRDLDYPFARQLEPCDSVDFISTDLQEQVQAFLLVPPSVRVSVWYVQVFSTRVCVRKASTLAIPACKSSLYWNLYLARRISPIPITYPSDI